MLKFSTNHLLHKTFLIFLILLILALALSWIPFFWHKDLILDKALFATEYYKTIIDLVKIFFGFWLANILLRKIREKELVEYFKPQWEEKTRNLLNAISTLKTISSNSNLNLKELTKQIHESDIKLYYLADIIIKHPNKNRLGELGNYSFEYNEYLHISVEQILESIEKGEIIELRPLNKEIIGSIDTLIEKLSARQGNAH